MRTLARATLSAGLLLLALGATIPSAAQQTTTVTAQLNDFTAAGSGSRAAIYLSLVGCSGGPRVSGVGILRPPTPIAFNDTGLATFTLYRKSVIDCAGQNTSSYLVTVKSDGATVWQKYCAFATASEDLSSTTYCTDTTPTPPSFYPTLGGYNRWTGTQDFTGATLVGVQATGVDLSSPSPIGSTTPNSVAFSTLASNGSASTVVPGIAQADFNAQAAITKTIQTDNLTIDRAIDVAMFIQTGVAAPGYTALTQCPNGGKLKASPGFGFALQAQAAVCDAYATAQSPEAVLALAANLTLTPANARAAVGVGEFNSLSMVPYTLAWDMTGAVLGSEFYNWGVVLTNVQVGKGGVGSYVKSNFWNGGVPHYTVWSAVTSYQTATAIQPPTGNGYWYQVTTPALLPYVCTTGVVAPATWTASEGATVTDGSCVYTAHAQSGEGMWQIGYRAQDWLGAGADFVVNNPFASGNAVVVRTTRTDKPANILFARGSAAEMVSGAADKYLMGLNSGANLDHFSLYCVGSAVTCLDIDPTGNITLNSGAGGQFFLKTNGGTGVINGGLSLTGTGYAAGGYSSGAGYDSVTGYKAGGVQFVNSTGNVDAAKVTNQTGTVPIAALPAVGSNSKIPTTADSTANVNGNVVTVDANHGHSDSGTAISSLAPKASPALTGSPTAPTATALDNSTKIATTAYADGAVATETSRATTAEGLLAPKASPTFTGTVDASGAGHTLSSKKGTVASLPGTCTQGEEYFATDATAGQNKYFCTATNTWTQQLNSGGGLKGVLLFTDSLNTIATTASTTGYFGDGTQSGGWGGVNIVVPVAGTVKNCYGRLYSGSWISGAQTVTFNLYKQVGCLSGNTYGACGVTMQFNSTTFDHASDTTNSCSVAAGDCLVMQYVTGSTSLNGTQYPSVSCQIQ